jgi:hypothetical protein
MPLSLSLAQVHTLQMHIFTSLHHLISIATWPFSTGWTTFALDNLSPSFLAYRDLPASQEPSAHHNKSPLATSDSPNMATYDGGQNTASTARVMPRHDAVGFGLDNGMASDLGKSNENAVMALGPELPFALHLILSKYSAEPKGAKVRSSYCCLDSCSRYLRGTLWTGRL